MKKVIYFLLLFLLSNCISQNQIFFENRSTKPPGENMNVMRVYIDKRGSIYPDNSIVIQKEKFIYGVRATETNANLKHYFLGEKNQLEHLAAHYKVSSNSNGENLYNAVQDKILQTIVADLTQLKKERNTDEVVIFIHGFNMEDPTPIYNELKKYIEKASKKNKVFLEVYWDGLSDIGNTLTAAKFWNFAQVNSSYVANAVRRIISATESDTKIRIITHSLGASVVTGALWNTSSKWPVTQGQNFYKEMRSISTPQHKDIRIGMLAPAIPGVNTFIDFNRRNNDLSKDTEILATENNIARVIIGYKEQDEVLRKFVNVSDKFGATTLGANALTDKKSNLREIDRVERLMKNQLNYNSINTPIRTVDFKDSTYPTEHGWYYYLKNGYALDNFLNLLFN